MTEQVQVIEWDSYENLNELADLIIARLGK